MSDLSVLVPAFCFTLTSTTCTQTRALLSIYPVALLCYSATPAGFLSIHFLCYDS